MAENLPADIASMSFEAALAELETIVKRLETGNAKLDDAISSYERGALLKQHCEAKLREAQTRVDRIVIGADGSPSVLCYPTDRDAYGRLTKLLTVGQMRAAKGECELIWSDLQAYGEGQVLIVVPPKDLDEGFIRSLTHAAADFPGQVWLAAARGYAFSGRISFTMRGASPPHRHLPPLRRSNRQPCAVQVSTPRSITAYSRSRRCWNEIFVCGNKNVIASSRRLFINRRALTYE